MFDSDKGREEWALMMEMGRASCLSDGGVGSWVGLYFVCVIL